MHLATLLHDAHEHLIGGITSPMKDALRQNFAASITSHRRDRLLLVSAFALALLALLGEVGESLGMDRQLKSNTSKTRTHSLFRQGCMLYDLIPNMPEHRLAPLMAKFAAVVSNAPEFGKVFAEAEMRGMSEGQLSKTGRRQSAICAVGTWHSNRSRTIVPAHWNRT